MYDEFDDRECDRKDTVSGPEPEQSQEQAVENEKQDSFYRASGSEIQQDTFDEQPRQEHSYGTYHMGNEQIPATEPPKKKGNGIAAKIAICAALALVFGVVGSAAFQVTNYVGNKLLPQEQSEAKIDSTGKIEQETNASDKTAASVTSQNVVAAVAKNTMPSIVAITSKSVQEVQTFFYGTQTQESESSGSGIIIGKNDSELLIATNNHVVEDAQALTVCFSVNVENQEEKIVEALVKGTDASHDLAVVAVKLADIPSDVMSQIKVAELGESENVEVGQWAIAIGNALGYGQSVTYGVVSALDREVSVETTSGTITNNLIQTDAAINFGNSGGALLNSSGEVIGINSVKAASTGVEGMGYAIPIDTAKPILDELMNQTTRTKVDSDERGLIGVTLAEINDEAKQVYNMPSGAFVREVSEGSAAEKAGIIKGDIITKIDNTTISSTSELMLRMEYYKAGETITLTVQAATNGEYKEREVTVTLDKKPKETQSTESQQQQQQEPSQDNMPNIFDFGE